MAPHPPPSIENRMVPYLWHLCDNRHHEATVCAHHRRYPGFVVSQAERAVGGTRAFHPGACSRRSQEHFIGRTASTGETRQVSTNRLRWTQSRCDQRKDL